MWLFSKKKNIIESGVLNGMTDIHSHILFGVDDGARDSDHARSIIKNLKGIGVCRSFATPHIMANILSNDAPFLTEVFSKLKPIAANYDFDVRLAAEYMLDEMFLEKLNGETKMLTYDGTHLLVEMSHLAPPANLEKILFEIQNSRYVPVLAHPERYALYFKQSDYTALKQRGCKFQANVLSFADVYGKNVGNLARKMLTDGMYDFIGSDAHNRRMAGLVKSIFLTNEQIEQISRLVKNNDTLWV